MSERSALERHHPQTTTYETVGDAVVPWRFTSLDEEYAALRGNAGLFDLSGAGLLAVEGTGAQALLSELLTREIDFLSPESSIIAMVLGEQAQPLDIVTVYKTDDGFVLETSVGRRTSTLEHLRAHAGLDVTIRDLRDEQTLLGFEGPAAWEVAEALLDEPITGLPFQGVRPVHVDGRAVTVARSGFTGEFGFKLVCPAADAEHVWTKASAFASPVGHEALEVAMVEVRQPLLHREGSATATVTACGFNWLVDIEKEEFLGRDALCAQRESGSEVLPVSFVCDALDVGPGSIVRADGEQIGVVVHAVRSPDLGVCGVAHLSAELAASGLVLAVDAAGGASVLQTVSAPARIPSSWASMVAAGGN